MTFQLHHQLKNDTITIGQFPLSLLLMMNQANIPWVILVPKKPNIQEIFELPEEDQIQLVREISLTSRVMKELYQADKINVAAIGNIVSQLHVHIVARYHHDVAWPSPIWGHIPRQEYRCMEKEKQVNRLRKAFGQDLEAI